MKYDKAYRFTTEWMVNRVAKNRYCYHEIKADYLKKRAEAQKVYGMGMKQVLFLSSIESAFAVRQLSLQKGELVIVGNNKEIEQAIDLVFSMLGFYQSMQASGKFLSIKAFAKELRKLMEQSVSIETTAQFDPEILKAMKSNPIEMGAEILFVRTQSIMILLLAQIEHSSWN